MRIEVTGVEDRDQEVEEERGRSGRRRKQIKELLVL